MNDALARVAGVRVAILGTVGPTGAPHLVPVTFAVDSDALVTAIDWKPKSGGPMRRLANLERDARATVLIQHYSENWNALWWVRVDGRAEIRHDGPTWERAIARLAAKYEQYRERPPQGAVIAITPENISSWDAGSAAVGPAGPEGGA